MSIRSLVLVSVVCAWCLACSEEAPAPDPGPASSRPASSTPEPPRGEHVPITSRSEEAIEIYRSARRAADRLLIEEAHDLFARAVELDPEFALAHLGLADTSKTFEGYFESLERAGELADNASDAERWWILGQLAGAHGNSTEELGYYSRLAENYPDDERVHDLLGLYFYEEQDFVQAAIHSRRACEIEPDFSSPWNNLGYSLMALGDFEAAEEAFRHYAELLPDEPNPWDSRGELLLKTGRAEEAIANYRTALELDPTFFSSRLAIGHAEIFLGREEAARESFTAVLESTDELTYRWEALAGLASVDLVEGDEEAAEDRLWEALELSREHGDRIGAWADLRLIGQLRLARGDAAGADELFRRSLQELEDSERDEAVLRTARTRHLFERGQVAVARGDLEEARRLESEYRSAIADSPEPAEMRRAHQLAGEIALAAGDWQAALDELAQADRTSSRVHYLQALAARGAGDPASALRFARRILERNEPYYGYAVYWEPAQELIAELESGAAAGP